MQISMKPIEIQSSDSPLAKEEIHEVHEKSALSECQH